MKVKKSKLYIFRSNIYIFITILLLTLSHCVAFVGTTVESIIEYSGYLFLLSGVIYSYYHLGKRYRKKNTSKIAFLLTMLMLPGIFLQNLPTTRKLTVAFTILAIIIVAIMAENYLVDYRRFRVMAYACLTGIGISMLISIGLGVPIIRYTSEPMFGMIYYFNGGIRDKNVATMMIAVLMSLYICYRESGRIAKIDPIIVAIAIVVLFFANSRGAWIECAVFIVMLNYKKIEKITKRYRWFVVLLLVLVAIPIVIFFYNNFILKSETFLYRSRGLDNYLAKFGDDYFHLIFGNAELAYGSGQDYAIAIRSVTGWNGTIENAWLNILIKSGILGIIAYIIIFVRAIYTAMKCRKALYKTIYLSVTMSLVISSFVAIYIQTIHGLFGIYCYLIMAYYSGMIRKSNYYKKQVGQSIQVGNLN